MRSKREKTIAVMLFVILTMSFMGVFVAAPDLPITIGVKTSGAGSAMATSGWTTAQAHTGQYSVHVDTTGATVGTSATLVIGVPQGITLGDILTISWWEYLVKGYAPHVDIMLDMDGNLATYEDCLIFEYANNGHTGDLPPTYGSMYGAWYQTFSDDGNGPAVIDGTSIAWSNGGGNLFLNSLTAWKGGLPSGAYTIDSNTPVVQLEIEVDNWLIDTEAYIDDVELNGINILDFTGSQGLKGDTGDQGLKGDTGDTGLTGDTGPQGDIGDTGPQGDIGDTGPQGDQGIQGLQGDKGDTGDQGLQGIQGVIGDTGPQGIRGLRGSTGPEGPEGSQGLDGINGTDGLQGETGLQGVQGLQGVVGADGEDGLQGPQGLTGDTGPQGLQGEQGETGEQGSKGSTGPKGVSGPTTLIYTGVAMGVVSLLGLLYQFTKPK